MGIEPTSRAWEAFVLPLNYTRISAAFYCAFRLPGGSSSPAHRRHGHRPATACSGILATPSLSAAIAVPSTPRTDLREGGVARGRHVVAERREAAVVGGAQCATGMNSAASSTRSRTCSAVSTTRVERIDDADEGRLVGPGARAMSFSTRRGRVRAPARCRSGPPAARTGSAAAARSRRRRCACCRGHRRGRCARRCAHAAALKRPAPGCSARRSCSAARPWDRSSRPAGPSVKSICTESAPSSQAAPHVGLVLVEQVVDEGLARVVRRGRAG
jgi:hypothetical protein